jgi:uncharacterized protein YneF (UPF0154 family)
MDAVMLGAVIILLVGMVLGVIIAHALNLRERPEPTAVGLRELPWQMNADPVVDRLEPVTQRIEVIPRPTWHP